MRILILAISQWVGSENLAMEKIQIKLQKDGRRDSGKAQNLVFEVWGVYIPKRLVKIVHVRYVLLTTSECVFF